MFVVFSVCVCVDVVGSVSSAWPGELRCHAGTYLQAGTWRYCQPLRVLSDCTSARDWTTNTPQLIDVVVVVIVQQLFSYCCFSRLRKSVTYCGQVIPLWVASDGLDSISMWYSWLLGPYA